MMKKLILILAFTIGFVYIPSEKIYTEFQEVSDKELDSISGRGFISGGEILIDFKSKKIILWDEIELGTKGGNK